MRATITTKNGMGLAGLIYATESLLKRLKSPPPEGFNNTVYTSAREHIYIEGDFDPSDNGGAEAMLFKAQYDFNLAKKEIEKWQEVVNKKIV